MTVDDKPDSKQWSIYDSNTRAWSMDVINKQHIEPRKESPQVFLLFVKTEVCIRRSPVTKQDPGPR